MLAGPLHDDLDVGRRHPLPQFPVHEESRRAVADRTEVVKRAADVQVADVDVHVCAADITYIPMARGVVCLVVVMDWASGKVLSWRLSPTLTADFCVAALEEALARFGCPEIFNTDQGSQFTSTEFLNVLRQRQIQISMDGKGCWRDNVFVERLWRSVKYEEVYPARL